MRINKLHGSYNVVRRTQRVKHIVVHYTGSGTSKAGNARANCVYFGRGYRAASANYFIDDSGIWEYADPGTYYTWHVGDGHGRYGITNAASVGIEVCSSGADFTAKEQSYLRDLVRSLMARFGVPASRVVRHYDASRKCCPAPYAPNGGDPTGKKWTALHAYITGGSSAKPSSAKPSAKPSSGKLAVTGWWDIPTTLALQKHFGTTPDGIVSGQYRGWREKGIMAACSSGWEWEAKATGSQVIRAIQKALGVKPDGVAGPDTINALEKYYGVKPDGKLSGPSDTVRKMQQALSAGRF